MSARASANANATATVTGKIWPRTQGELVFTIVLFLAGTTALGLHTWTDNALAAWLAGGAYVVMFAMAISNLVRSWRVSDPPEPHQISVGEEGVSYSGFASDPVAVIAEVRRQYQGRNSPPIPVGMVLGDAAKDGGVREFSSEEKEKLLAMLFVEVAEHEEKAIEVALAEIQAAEVDQAKQLAGASQLADGADPQGAAAP